MQFQYDALEYPSEQVRIAVLQPGSYNDVIRITFEVRKLSVSEPR
jgi:hypothetical protein